MNAIEHGAKVAVPRVDKGYNLTYSVLADGRLEAIEKAVVLLRTGVKLHRVMDAEQGVPGWWDVVLHVSEVD